MFVKRVGVRIWGTGGHRTDVYWPFCADGSCMPAQPVGGGGSPPTEMSAAVTAVVVRAPAMATPAALNARVMVATGRTTLPAGSAATVKATTVLPALTEVMATRAIAMSSTRACAPLTRSDPAH